MMVNAHAASGLSKIALLLVLSITYALAYQPEGVAGNEWETIEPGGETRCSQDTPFRFFVREADADRLLIFFNGGGACYSTETCAAGLEGDAPTYRVDATAEWGNDPRVHSGVFDFDNPENPLREWSQVFVSYCTGDVHLGDAIQRYRRADGSEFTIFHRGMVNAQAALAHVFERFDAPGTVMVAGGSAGAIASPIMLAKVATAYPDARILHFAGGGFGYRMPPPVSLWRNWGAIEAMNRFFAAGNFSEDTTTLLDPYLAVGITFPHITFHLFDHAYDSIQEGWQRLLGYPAELLPGLDANLAEVRETLANVRSFVARGEFHTLLRYDELYTHVTDSVRAVDWVATIARGEPVDNVHCGAPDACRSQVTE